MTSFAVFRIFRCAVVVVLLLQLSAGCALAQQDRKATSVASTASSATVVDPTACAHKSAPSWCSGSDIGAWTNAAAAYLCSASSGGHISIPSGTYTLTTEIGPLCSGIELYGAGSGATTLEAAAGFQGRILHPVGSAVAPVNGLKLHDMTIENGAPTTGIPAPTRDGVRCDYCSNLTIYNLAVASVEGYYGIVIANSNNVSVHNNTVQNFGYGGIMNVVHSGGTSSSIEIENNVVEGCVNTATGLCYGISISGSEDSTIPVVTNGTVSGNTVSNIPTWECYDAHDGVGLSFTGNSGANCYFGMQLGTVSGGSMSNVLVANNTLTQDSGSGGALLNGYGIVLAGESVASPVVGATIKGNTVTGYGAGESGKGAMVGAITLISTMNVQVSNNSIPSYFQAAIVLYGLNVNTTIQQNSAGNLLGAYTPQSSAMIELASGGAWGTYVTGNSLTTETEAQTPVAFLSAGYANSAVSFGAHNRVTTPNTSTAAGSPVTVRLVAGGSVPVDLTQMPTFQAGYDFSYTPGTIGYGPGGEAAYSFSAPEEALSPDGGTGFFSLDTVDVISTGNTTAGSNIVTGLAGGLGGSAWPMWLPAGMNLAIAGAGSGGATLYAHVVASNGSTLTLDTAAAASTSHASIRWQAGQVSAM